MGETKPQKHDMDLDAESNSTNCITDVADTNSFLPVPEEELKLQTKGLLLCDIQTCVKSYLINKSCDVYSMSRQVYMYKHLIFNR